MMNQTLKTVPLRRKREGKTDYRKRVRLLSSEMPRLIVRPTLRSIIIQIAAHGVQGDNIQLGATAYSLEKYGWIIHKGNIPAAYLTGYLLGRIAKKKGITEVVLDSGLLTPVKGGRIYACVSGLIDAGIKIPASKEVLPSAERIKGEHIAAYAKAHKEIFSDYQKKGIEPATIAQLFEKVKKAIERGL